METREPGLAYHCLSGTRHGFAPVNTLIERAAAAAGAGFTSIGACPQDVTSERDARTIAAVLSGLGVQVASLEWAELSAPEDDDTEYTLSMMAGVFGATRLNTGWCSADEPHGVARRLRRLARSVAPHGLTVAVEPIVFSSMPDVITIQNLIHAAGEPNVGLLLDTFQLGRFVWSPQAPPGLDASLVSAVQVTGLDYLNPTPTWPQGLLYDAQHGRRLPSEGDFPVLWWLWNLQEVAGVDAPWEIEVISDELRGMTAIGAARALRKSWDELTVQAREVIRTQRLKALGLAS